VKDMNKNLLAILACPLCKGELLFDAANKELICKVDQMAYPIVDEIPVMLVDRARKISTDN
jgi:uncharacterized protein YbaR (Trm112 family)